MHSNYKLKLATVVVLATFGTAALAQVDPGVRGGPPGIGGPAPGLSPSQLRFFNVGLEEFSSAENTADGLGPRLNLDSCISCHSFPAVGGTSPPINPQVAFATAFGQRNVLPPGITRTGPIREARFIRRPDGTPDGGVHQLFTIAGREDGSVSAANCNIAQEDFATQAANRNLVFRIPTPLAGTGFIENIRDQALLNNLAANAAVKAALGISGRFNRNGNDGTISRFGWKAQNQTLLIFSGEAYNVEMGITNEIFQVETDQTVACQFATTPNDVTETDEEAPENAIGGENKFAQFMRNTAMPVRSFFVPGGAASIARGSGTFNAIGCDECHTPTLRTPITTVAAFSNRDVNLFSDLALHNMGPGLADQVSQGLARGDEFRTPPLWGVGQRVFFMHDGRTNNLLGAIAAHRSNANAQFPASEANRVIDRFNALSVGQKQDVLNFLRSL